MRLLIATRIGCALGLLAGLGSPERLHAGPLGFLANEPSHRESSDRKPAQPEGPFDSQSIQMALLQTDAGSSVSSPPREAPGVQDDDDGQGLVGDPGDGAESDSGELEKILLSEPELRVQSHPPHRAPKEGVLFSKYLQDERFASTPSLSGARGDQLRKWALQLRDLRKSKRRFSTRSGYVRVMALAPTEEAFDSELIPACRGNADAKARVQRAQDNPFCGVALRAPRQGAGSAPASRKSGRVSKATAKKVERSLLAAKFTELERYTEKELSVGLKRVRDLELLFPVFNFSLKQKTCPSPRLLTQLGQKSESGFPSAKFQELAVLLYSRSIACGGSDAGIRAGYRLGLILVWQKKWKEADEVLAKVGDFAEGADFRARVLYWRAKAAVELKQSKLAATLRSQLIRDYPLSVHAYLASMSQGPGEVGLPKIQNQEPQILFRSVRLPEVNQQIQALQILGKIGAPEMVSELAESILKLNKQLEPELQLYLITEMRKTGNLSHNFKYLAELFRDYPEMIASSTLSLLYPLHRFDLVQAHQKSVDPYLVMSLIRQESAFNEKAKSSAGAKGLMQLMPSTARRLERGASYALYQPKVNIRLGVKFFGRLLERFEGRAEDALAGYNAGPDRVDEWRRRYPVEDPLLFVDLIPFKETREYVGSIARNYYWYLKLYQPQGLEQNLKQGTRSPASISSRFMIFQVAHHKKE